ncbi:AAA family ATPase [Candidatus Dojkabacteria bacterium]|nr:AAA family ATPase [Candidatus Dojkabacteria bacterium]
MLSFKKYLNPIISSIDKLLDFSDIANISPEFEKEYPYLAQSLKVISKQIQSLLQTMDQLEKELEVQVRIIDTETGDDKAAAVKIYNQLLKKIQEVVRRINIEASVLDSPYFGKVVFDRERSGNFPAGKITAYIGKFAYFDRESKASLITDWRAPIANLYYTNSGPVKNVEFTSPRGIQKGDIEEKKMFEISKSRIKSIYDSKSGNSAADEFLLSQLNQKIGQKLTDIVSTIQNEQNLIIRDTINKLVVLQGVAGSGKTTIVLHRLAYLFFAYPNMSSKRTLIIAPNKLFLDYISGVLPSLGIDGVEANTYLFWAKKILKWDNKYILSTASPDLESQKVKGSKEFLVELIEKFDEYIENLLQTAPYSDKEKLYSNYYEIRRKSPGISTFEALHLSLEKIKSELLFKNTSLSMSKLGILTEVISNNVLKHFKDNLSLFAIYKGVIAEMEIHKAVKDRTKSTLKKAKRYYYYELEDLAPLTILHLLLNGASEIQKDYIIADEAQDLSFPQIYSLLMVSKNNNLMLAGDLAQAIKTPNNIDDWIELLDTFRHLKTGKLTLEYHQLNKCYRTTIEIMEYVTSKIDGVFPKTYLRPQAVLRHGEPVVEIKTEHPLLLANSSVDSLTEVIMKEVEKNRNTIAIIAKSSEGAETIYRKLSENKDVAEHLVPMESNNYSSGIIVTSVLNAKGLEFDTVFLIDVSKEEYNANFEDARKFYVATTRALHMLYITYPVDNPSTLLKNDK